MRKVIVHAGAFGAAVGLFSVAWRRNPRMGTRFVNDVGNEALATDPAAEPAETEASVNAGASAR